jgi:hypothetical protein
MSDPQTRFYASWNTRLPMLLAIVFAHVGRSMMKKASTTKQNSKKGSHLVWRFLVIYAREVPW